MHRRRPSLRPALAVGAIVFAGALTTGSAAEAARPATTVVAPVSPSSPASPASPACTTLGVIGDSITVGSEHPGDLGPVLEYLGWTPVIDAMISRRIPASAARPYSGVKALRSMRSSGYDACTWVIALGTNDLGNTREADASAYYRGLVAEMLGEIGDGHRVVWVNVYTTKEPSLAATFNAVLDEFAAAGRLDVVDYAGWIVHHLGYVRDGVHLDGAGYKARTALLAAYLGTPVSPEAVPRPLPGPANRDR